MTNISSLIIYNPLILLTLFIVLSFSLCSVSSVSGTPIHILTLPSVTSVVFLTVPLVSLVLFLELSDWLPVMLLRRIKVKRVKPCWSERPLSSGLCWPRLSRRSLCLRRSACWRARRRSEACTPSSGEPSPPAASCPCNSSIILYSLYRRNQETTRDEFIFYSKRLMRLLIEHSLTFLPSQVLLNVYLVVINVLPPPTLHCVECFLVVTSPQVIITGVCSSPSAPQGFTASVRSLMCFT